MKDGVMYVRDAAFVDRSAVFIQRSKHDTVDEEGTRQCEHQ